MEYRLDTRTSWVCGGLALLVTLLVFSLFSPDPWWAWLGGCVLVSAGLWGYAYLAEKHARWGVRDGAFWCRTGLLLIAERRIPLADVTGIILFRTPLERPLGVCYLTVCAAGSATLLISVRIKDAEALMAAWGGRS